MLAGAQITPPKQAPSGFLKRCSDGASLQRPLAPSLVISQDLCGGGSGKEGDQGGRGVVGARGRRRRVPVDQLLQVPLIQRHAVRAARLLPARARASTQEVFKTLRSRALQRRLCLPFFHGVVCGAAQLLHPGLLDRPQAPQTTAAPALVQGALPAPAVPQARRCTMVRSAHSSSSACSLRT
jgi:hypothetical protein